MPPFGDREARRVELKRPFSDGTVAIDLDPLSFLCRLAAAVPPPRAHLVRYDPGKSHPVGCSAAAPAGDSGVLSAAHRWRERVVPPEPEADANDDVCEHGHPLGEEVAEPFPQRSTHRSGARAAVFPAPGPASRGNVAELEHPDANATVSSEATS